MAKVWPKVGSKKVIMASCAPPIRYPNVCDIDMPSRAELVAPTEEAADATGMDHVIFRHLPMLPDLVHERAPAEYFDRAVRLPQIRWGVRHGRLGHGIPRPPRRRPLGQYEDKGHSGEWARERAGGGGRGGGQRWRRRLWFGCEQRWSRLRYQGHTVHVLACQWGRGGRHDRVA
ncbi:hypothetical protein H4582DRAFT_518899 [Lactarius indigo]|nr:hypothetical protein H4582DRAFT_518899 [Lactarius indigo]